MIIKPIEEPKNDTTFYKYAWVIYLAWLLFGLGHFIFVNEDHVGIKLVAPGILLLKALYNIYFPGIRKTRFLKTDDEGITWTFEGYDRQEKVYWNELRAVRFQGSYIVLYGESSIDRLINLNDFQTEDQHIILNEVSKFVTEKKLDFVNARPALD